MPGTVSTVAFWTCIRCTPVSVLVEIEHLCRLPVCSVVWSRNGRVLITGGHDGRIVRWNVEQGAVVRPSFWHPSLRGHSPLCPQAQLHGKGKQLNALLLC